MDHKILRKNRVRREEWEMIVISGGTLSSTTCLRNLRTLMVNAKIKLPKNP